MDSLDIDDVSFDIIECFPEEICRNIFGNLEANDLLEASLVSTEWYKYIAKTAVCMQKLTLRFSYQTMQQMTPSMKNILVESSRRYENVELTQFTRRVDDLQDILKVNGRKWKKVKMSLVNFSFVSDFINLIAIIEPTVEELRLLRVFIDNIYKDQPRKQLKFPKLKICEVKSVQSLIYHEALEDINTLEEFNIANGQQSTESSEALKKMFRNNKGIKRQSISSHFFDQFFSEDISQDFCYKLTSFTVIDFYDSTENLKNQFRRFLELHMNTLESFTVYDWMGLECVKMIFHMPKLKQLSLKGFFQVDESLDWKETDVNKSFSLTSLELMDIRLNVEMLTVFITATPNLKTIKLYSISDEILACISSLLPGLESLSVDMFEALDVTDKAILPNLKEIKIKVLADNIKISETDEDRGNFERLFIAKAKEIAPGKEDHKPRIPKRPNINSMGFISFLKNFAQEDWG